MEVTYTSRTMYCLMRSILIAVCCHLDDRLWSSHKAITMQPNATKVNEAFKTDRVKKTISFSVLPFFLSLSLNCLNEWAVIS